MVGQFRAHMLHAAKIERQRWGSILPGGVKQTLIEGSSWSSLGPTQAHTLQNGATTLMVTDSGRVRTIIADGRLTSPPRAAACGSVRAAPGRR